MTMGWREEAWTRPPSVVAITARTLGLERGGAKPFQKTLVCPGGADFGPWTTSWSMPLAGGADIT